MIAYSIVMPPAGAYAAGQVAHRGWLDSAIVMSASLPVSAGCAWALWNAGRWVTRRYASTGSEWPFKCLYAAALLVAFAGMAAGHLLAQHIFQP
jgi:hypothetical protein